MNYNKDIDQIIIKVLSGTATDSERKDLLAWEQESKRNSFQLNQLRKTWNQRSIDSKLIGHEEQKEKIWNRYLGDNGKTKITVVRPLYKKKWFKMVAVILILMIPGYLIYNTNEDIIVEIKPEVAIINKENPSGQKSLIQLPDGSKVWLNSASQISYNEIFLDSIRSIKLEGEAYFEVVRDTLRPFIVDLGPLSITVLGTEFNVNSFSEQSDVNVTLIGGSVKVTSLQSDRMDDITLIPGTGIIYSRDKKEHIEYSKFSRPDLFFKATGWKKGLLVFDGNDFEEFVREISRWYGIQVSVIGVPPRNWRIVAKFENELLTNVMETVSYNKGFNFKLKDKKLEINFN